MTARELRQKYLRFFESKGHTVHPSGSLIPVDVTGRLDESLLFNGAGMVQFKPYFRGAATPPNPRLATAQKCVRTGDIESVGDLSHLTFFEMLGNFSFGDYFKKDAIAYSWEFLTSPEWLGLDPKRLSFTVFQEDDEAYGYWSEHLRAAGIDPETRVFRLGEETNYWPAGAFSSGPPGPCGPNSEMFYWTSNEVPPPPTSGAGAYTAEDWIRDDDAKNWLEIWNDVFIQYEWQGELKNPERPADGYRKTGMPNLPFQSIDTGMGLERTTAVLNGFSSVYDTDLFAPILQRIQQAAGKPFDDETSARAARIIADHIRTACFCIADGILPSNNGRGYVLRRLIRRAVLKGARTLGFQDLFLYTIYDGVAEALGDHYRELIDRRDVIVETLKNEEALFRRTLEQGYEVLADELAKFGPGTKVLSGGMAFKLYDTFGFPLEVTQELCEEAGVDIDLDGYEAALREAQERSRAGSGMETVYGGVTGVAFVIVDDEGRTTPTSFLGYSATEANATIKGVRLVGADAPGEFVLALDQTPFYAESGGQQADHGTIESNGFKFEVEDVTKHDGVFVHLAKLVSYNGEAPTDDEAALKAFFNQPVRCVVAGGRRTEITRNHTATHLLHAALRQVLGKHVTQAGSQVSPEHLRFDFTHVKALSHEELFEVEQIVYEQILAAQPVRIYDNVPLDDARAMGAMALFGEKYGDRVRVVQIGGMEPTQPSFSRELCGGIHVQNTGQIGLFKIVHESSAASGVRRIEAITGTRAYGWAIEQHTMVREAAEKLKSNPHDLIHAVEKVVDALKEERKKVEKLRTQNVSESPSAIVAVGPVELAVQQLEAEPKEGGLIADRLADSQPNRVVFVAAVHEGKITFTCKVGADALAKGAHAGNLVKAIAPLVGGGGGGRPDFATAGGRDPGKLEAAMQQVEPTLRTQVGG